MLCNFDLSLYKHLLVALLLITATTKADLINDVASNVQQFFQPAQSVAESIAHNIGANIVSFADNAGNGIASVATHAAEDIDSLQGNKINSELSKFESSSLRLTSGSAASLFVAV
ncbi:hypothetical protein GGF40_002815, partial [Coemansia sp. RSA 1286]